MKQWTAALLAALFLLLAACQQNPTDSIDLPAQPTPTKPASPEPKAETETAPTADPIEPPEDEPAETPSTQPQPTDTSTAINFANQDGTEMVTLYLTSMHFVTDTELTNEIISAYYQTAYQKIQDYCANEVMALAEESGNHYTVTAEGQLERNDQKMLSVSRTVTVTADDTDLRTVTYYSETFDRTSGGLLTAEDFFAADEAAYTSRLIECVRRQISEDPYHDQNYFAQWEDLAERQFQKERFFITDDAYVVYYQENELGPSAALYPIPWSQLEDILNG